EVGITIDREKAADLGVSVNDVALSLRLLVGGIDVSSYLEQGNEYDVNVRADRSYRADVDGLALVTVPSSRLGSVPLTEVVHIERSSGPSQINHTGRRRQVMLLSNIGTGSSEGAIGAALVKGVKALNLPPGYQLQAVGRSREMARAQRTFLIAFALSF